MGKNTIPPQVCFLWLGIWALSVLTNFFAALASQPVSVAASCYLASFAACMVLLHGFCWIARGIIPFQPPSNSQTCPSSESTPNPQAVAEILSPEASK